MLKKIFLIAVIITLWASPVFAVEEMVEEEHFYRGRVLSINEMEVEEHDFFSIYQQEVVVLLTSGPFRGKTVNIINTHFAEDQVHDLVPKENQEVIIVTIGEEGSFEQVHIQDLARDRGIYYLIGVFILVVLVVGRMKGIKTLVALAVTLGLIMGGFLPLLLQGYSPILLAIGLASIAITFTLLLIGGFNLKSLTAILGTIAGVIIAGLMAFWAGSIARLTGFGTEEAQMLFFMDQTIDVRGLLF
ncbi:MAG TPA: YibE/F family protein, partial [Bacteroidales bacterium]|nr:YibE/F family protein [Bacteroidales bacterium]